MVSMVDQLPDEYQDAVKLAYLEGLSQKEVAAKDGISLSGAKSRVQRGRALLRDVFEQCCTVTLSTQNQLIGCEPSDDDCPCC